MMTFQTPSQDWLSRRPVREPASRGRPPDDEGWGLSQPQGGLSVLEEAQWWEPGLRHPSRCRERECGRHAACSRQAHRISQKASPHRVQHQGSEQVIPTSTSIRAHTPHPRMRSQGQAAHGELSALPQPPRPRGMTRTRGWRSPGNRHSTATRCMGVLGWGPLPTPLTH